MKLVQKYYTTASARSGFTLIELSIVLVIIGLLVGGVMTGRDLIRRTEILRIYSRTEEFTAAANTFKAKYGGLPGDLSNATDFWGTDPSGCPDTPASATPQTATCNGNGDGRITNHEVAVNIYQRREMYRFFQHLANAGLIAGQYTGTLSSPSYDSYFGFKVGLNVPKVYDDLFVVYVNYFWSWTAANPYIFEKDMGNSWFSSCSTTAGAFTKCGITPEELYVMDGKYDDGKPGTGKILGYKAGACVTTTDPSTAQYVSGSAITCGFYIKLAM